MSEESCLDRQVWGMLGGRLAHLAQGGEAAKRIDPRYGPFAAARNAEEEAQAALAALIEGPDDEIWVVEPEPWRPPPGARVLREATLLQMIAEADGPAPEADPEIVPLGEADVAEMTELALATKPGPWVSMTHRYGPFFGIRREGILAAMAGERMLPGPGFAEVSAVCTWPQFQGQGLGGRLIRHVMAGLRVRGDRPYLHTYADNTGAIGLYRKLGFVERRSMILTVLGRA